MINKIKIDISLGNDTMLTTEDVLQTLRRVADKLEDVGCDREYSRFADIKIRDVDGNTIGSIACE